MTERITTTGIIKESGEEMTLDELEQLNGASVAGQELKKIERFGIFKPKSVSVEAWAMHLGPHGIIFDHMSEQREEVQDFIQNGNVVYSIPEQKILLSTAQSHDMGEYIIGDIPHPEKTNDHHNLEMQALFDVLNDSLHGEVDWGERLRFIGRVQDTLTFTDSEVGLAFGAVERVGYMNASFNAWNSLTGEKDELQSQLRTLAHVVVPSHIPELVKFSKKYPYIQGYLHDHMDKINEIMEDSVENNGRVGKEQNEAQKSLRRFLNQ